MTNVECIYCKRKCQRTNKISTWKCDYHGDIQISYSFPHEPYVISKESQYIMQYYMNYNDKLYSMNFYYNYPSLIVKFTLNNVLFNSDIGNISKTIFHLNFHPEITPENAISKLSTFLILS